MRITSPFLSSSSSSLLLLVLLLLLQVVVNDDLECAYAELRDYLCGLYPTLVPRTA